MVGVWSSRVLGLRVRGVWGFEFSVQGFGVEGLGVWGLGFKGFGVWGLEFRGL